MVGRLESSDMVVEFVEIDPRELTIDGDPKDIYRSYHFMVGETAADFNDVLKKQGLSEEQICSDADITGTFRNMYIQMGKLLQQQNESDKEPHVEIMRQLRGKCDTVTKKYNLDFILAPTLEHRAAEGALYPTEYENEYYRELIKNPNLNKMLDAAAERSFNDSIHALSVNPQGKAALAIPNPRTLDGLGSVQLIAVNPHHERKQLMATALEIDKILDLSREVTNVHVAKIRTFMDKMITQKMSKSVYR
jgi:hypothetical protein